MRVPDTITLGPSRFQFDRDSSLVSMEVPNRIRPGGNENVTRLDEADVLMSNSPNAFAQSIIVQPSTLQRSQIDDYVAVQPPETSDETVRSLPTTPTPFRRSTSMNVAEKDVVKELKNLQKRFERFEQSVAKRNTLDLCFQLFLVGCIAYLYFRRSTSK